MTSTKKTLMSRLFGKSVPFLSNAKRFMNVSSLIGGNPSKCASKWSVIKTGESVRLPEGSLTPYDPQSIIKYGKDAIIEIEATTMSQKSHEQCKMVYLYFRDKFLPQFNGLWLGVTNTGDEIVFGETEESVVKKLQAIIPYIEGIQSSYVNCLGREILESINVDDTTENNGEITCLDEMK